VPATTVTLTIEGRSFPVQRLYLEDAVALTGYQLQHGERPYGRRSACTSTSVCDHLQ